MNSCEAAAHSRGDRGALRSPCAACHVPSTRNTHTQTSGGYSRRRGQPSRTSWTRRLPCRP
eukprot:2301763-Prymnesium_polylepis.1